MKKGKGLLWCIECGKDISKKFNYKDPEHKRRVICNSCYKAKKKAKENEKKFAENLQQLTTTGEMPLRMQRKSSSLKEKIATYGIGGIVGFIVLLPMYALIFYFSWYMIYLVVQWLLSLIGITFVLPWWG